MKRAPRKNLSLPPKEAIELQQELKERISLEPLSSEPHLIAGADVSLEWHGDTAFAGIIVLTYPELEVVEQALAERKIDFPYIPGLLSFREIPALLDAWEKLKTKPDITFVDGHGIAHPRRMGIASHFGLVTDSPTIGVAKNKLFGEYLEPDPGAGSFSYLSDKKTGERIGAVVRTKTGVKPVFVSPGHKISLEEAVEMVLGSTLKHKLPEPTRLAHDLTNRFRRGEIKV